IALVEILNGVKGDSRRLANHPIKRPCDLRAYLIRHKPLSSTFKNANYLALWLDGAHSIVGYRAPTTAPGLTFACTKTVPRTPGTSNKSLDTYSLTVTGGARQWQAPNGQIGGSNGKDG